MQTPEEFVVCLNAYDYINISPNDMPELARQIAARDAEIRRECAERAQDEWEQLFCDDMIGDREFVTKKLRAAIKGALHE